MDTLKNRVMPDHARIRAMESTESIRIPAVLGPRVNEATKRTRDEPLLDVCTPKKRTRVPDDLSPAQMTGIAPPQITRPMQGPKPLRSSRSSFVDSVNATIFSQNPTGNLGQIRQTNIPDNEPAFPELDSNDYLAAEAGGSVQFHSSDFPAGSLEDLMRDISEDDLLYGNDSPDGPGVLGAPLDMDTEDVPRLTDEEAGLRDRLRIVFPILPYCLHAAPLCIRYEVTRVFLHAEVSLLDFDAPISSDFNDYDTLWRFLRDLPCLKGRPFPERSNKEAWTCALDTFQRKFHSVVFAGSLQFNSKSSDQDGFFKLKLDPLKLDLSHRLGRRFGHDRFMEISIPLLTGRRVPELLSTCGPDLIYEWLVDSSFPLCSRHWSSYFVKSKDKQRKRNTTSDLEVADPAFRIYLFATDAPDFVRDDRLIQYPDLSKAHAKMSVKQLLNSIRPIRKNEHQAYTKLFARTSLAVSRNYATVVLSRQQIRFQDQDIKSGNEVMNDGAARISYILALKITKMLGNSYLPTAFQGRFGEAKGLWVVDHTDREGKDWLEIFPSQQKWARSTKAGGESDDISHRIFEVLMCSSTLKSADLNTQLIPLLMDRAKNKPAMVACLVRLMKEGSKSKLDAMQEAMDDPQSYRHWIRTCNPNTNQRLKANGVPYRAGQPVALEERLNVMLDAGFDPKKLSFMKDMGRQLFKAQCDKLKERFNITVGRSTYAYMVPDFWGVLEPGEVYIDLSNFVDKISGFSGVILNGDYVLVARSPAHLVSDVQKVRVSFKPELMGMKDVIVFSIKGNHSLASMLSGGDYDGDRAWVCWEPDIVDNFINADVPNLPDLVKDALLKQDTRSYQDVVQNHPGESTSVFLKHAFAFTIKPSLLGSCTNYKERFCYAQKSVNTPQSVAISTLLGCLVDAPKQGYIFEESDWATFRKAFRDPKIKSDPPQPLWKKTNYTLQYEPGQHILDLLKHVARETVDEALAKLHNVIVYPPQWDDDLVGYCVWARAKAKNDPEWRQLMIDLDADLEILKNTWNSHFNRSPNDPNKPEFSTFTDECYEKFCNIKPHVDIPLTEALLSDYPKMNLEMSRWSLLKASTLFASYSRNYVGNMVWWLGGRQLVYLKAESGKGGAPYSMTPGMYIIGKPDSVTIRRLKAVGNAEILEDVADVVNEEDLYGVDDDD